MHRKTFHPAAETFAVMLFNCYILHATCILHALMFLPIGTYLVFHNICFMFWLPAMFWGISRCYNQWSMHFCKALSWIKASVKWINVKCKCIPCQCCVQYCLFCYRERTPPRPQGQRPEPENRGVSTAYTPMSATCQLSSSDILTLFLTQRSMYNNILNEEKQKQPHTHDLGMSQVYSA